jgi:hypothetical protein
MRAHSFTMPALKHFTGVLPFGYFDQGDTCAQFQEDPMANSALFIGWKGPRTGREAECVEFFQTSIEYWNGLVGKGNVESIEPVILARHGGDLNGFFLVRGDANKLNAVMQTDEYLNFQMQASYLIEGYGVVQGYLGDNLRKVMNSFQKQIK